MCTNNLFPAGASLRDQTCCRPGCARLPPSYPYPTAWPVGRSTLFVAALLSQLGTDLPTETLLYKGILLRCSTSEASSRADPVPSAVVASPPGEPSQEWARRRSPSNGRETLAKRTPGVPWAYSPRWHLEGPERP